MKHGVRGEYWLVALVCETRVRKGRAGSIPVYHPLNLQR